MAGVGQVMAFGTRQSRGMLTLVMSGGFAANPAHNPLLKARIKAVRFLPGPLYRAITLRMASLSSQYDGEGQVPWSEAKSRKLFEENTPFRSYVARQCGTRHRISGPALENQRSHSDHHTT